MTLVRATTCGAFATANPEFVSLNPGAAEVGCKRLPRHNGEHRKFLTQSAANKANRAKAPKATKARATRPTVERAPLVVLTLEDALSDPTSWVAQAFAADPELTFAI